MSAGENADIVVDLHRIVRSFPIGKKRVLPVLKGLDLAIHDGEFVSLMGPSGSGKSTLMNIIACLDSANEGSYHLAGTDITRLGDAELAAIRAERIGIVFQFFHLLPQISVSENVELPLFYLGVRRRERRAKAHAALEHVNMGHRISHRPLQLSGGEMQRVAIARALINNPPLIIADEPTGALDSKNGADIMNLFHRLHGEGKTLILVTHDPELGEQAERIVYMRDGIILDHDFSPEGQQA